MKKYAMYLAEIISSLLNGLVVKVKRDRVYGGFLLKAYIGKTLVGVTSYGANDLFTKNTGIFLMVAVQSKLKKVKRQYEKDCKLASRVVTTVSRRKVRQLKKAEDKAVQEAREQLKKAA